MAIRDELRSFKKERILEEAISLFYDRGYRGTSLNAIAQRLDVTKPFIYAYYASKSELLVEIFRRVVTLSVTCVRNVRSQDLAPSEKLRRFACDYTHLVLREQRVVAVFFREQGSIPKQQIAEINRLKEMFDDELSALIEEGVKEGTFNVPDVRLATLSLVGMMSWAYVWYREDGRLDADRIAMLMASFAARVVGQAPSIRAAAAVGR